MPLLVSDGTSDLPSNTKTHGYLKWKTHLSNSKDTPVLKDDGDFGRGKTDICQSRDAKSVDLVCVMRAPTLTVCNNTEV
jgi:hypothetical protein